MAVVERYRRGGSRLHDHAGSAASCIEPLPIYGHRLAGRCWFFRHLGSGHEHRQGMPWLLSADWPLPAGQQWMQYQELRLDEHAICRCGLKHVRSG